MFTLVIHSYAPLILFQTLLVPSSKSKEDDHDDSDHDDSDHDDDDDSNESDDSHENEVTPTDTPFTLPVTPDSFTGRGDSAPYGFKARVDLAQFEKVHKKSGKVKLAHTQLCVLLSDLPYNPE